MLLNETLSQPFIFIVFLLLGFGCGFFCDLKNYILFICNKNNIIDKLLDFFLSILNCSIFYIALILFNYGELRIYLILTFVLGIFLQRYTLGRIIAKLFKTCYNFMKKFFNRLNYGKQKKKEKITNC